MTASERLERLTEAMQGSREWPLDLGSPLGRDYGRGWDLSHPMETAIKDVLRALPELIVLVRAAELAIPVSACDYPDGACEHECGRTKDDHSGCLRIKGFKALTALERKLGSE